MRCCVQSTGCSRTPVLVICDEPYRPLTFDGAVTPEAVRIFDRAVIAWSWSKAMAIPGERIGYLALAPHLPGIAQLRGACAVASRILGYINAPAIWQQVVGAVSEVTVDVARYEAKRDLLCDALQGMGYEAPRPQGAFYIWARTPIPDDVAFIGLLQREGILAVPGIGFGRSGYMRLSLTISPGCDRAFAARFRAGYGFRTLLARGESPNGFREVAAPHAKWATLPPNSAYKPAWLQGVSS